MLINGGAMARVSPAAEAIAHQERFHRSSYRFYQLRAILSSWCQGGAGSWLRLRWPASRSAILAHQGVLSLAWSSDSIGGCKVRPASG